MSYLDYHTGIPDAPNNPSNDQPLMKENNDNTELWVKIDHAGFENTQGGYHTVVHLVTQAADPAIVGLGEAYSKSVTQNAVTDTALFYRSGLGTITQLTGTLVPSASANGYSFLPGGIRIMWGSFLTGSGPGSLTGTELFTPNFSTAVYSVVLVEQVNDGTANVALRLVPALTGFTWIRNITTASTIHWIAIGV